MGYTIYKTQDGKRVPSVTTINKLLSIGGNEGLLYWANKMGLRGLDLKEAREQSADVGTFAHHWMQADISGHTYDPHTVGMTEAQAALVIAAHDQWARWREQVQIKMIATEMPLVSEAHGFGGTPDFIGSFADGRVVLGDLKTGGVYPEHLMQISAYGMLWEENGGQPINEYLIIRTGKEDASFRYSNWDAQSESLVIARDLFLTALRLKPLADKLAKAVRG